MLIEYLSYLVTFVVTVGITAIGIMVSYQLFQLYKKSELSILLYQQIFLFSFFIYGIWGNIALREIVADLNLTGEITAKLAFFIPIIGIPFMVVSWFMLLKFGFNVNGYKVSKGFVFSYFPSFLIVLFGLAVIIQKGILKIPVHSELFIVRIIAAINLTIHFVFLVPFLITKKYKLTTKELGFDRKWVVFYLLGVLLYSAALSFYNILGYISTCVSILMLFGTSILIPLRIKIYSISNSINPSKNIDFEAFCKLYEISKREAEIILEICTGKSNKAIAEKLFITLQTVKDHNHRIYTKIGVQSRVQLTNLVREKTGSATNK